MGLEVHVELNTTTKMFCGCTTTFGAEPNTQVCPVCLGLPGALPVVNEIGVESAIRIGLALNCEIATWCRFARKNYFYPDMPKNFQTSSTTSRSAFGGYLDVELDDGTVYRVEIERAHMEEDTGKSTARRRRDRSHPRGDALARRLQPGRHPAHRDRHEADGRSRGAGAGDRQGVCRNAARPAQGARCLRRPMEQGSMRCDVNVSLSPKGSDAPVGTRSETKNVNSLRSVERAVRYEMTRHAAILSSGGSMVQETRHWHEDTGITTSGREKSDAEDYRYFPEPDLVPIAPSRETIEELRATLPEPPGQRRKRLQGEWGYSDLEMRDVVNAGLVDLIE
jgi:aspartyl-tRNA(Asn)/glutamyl-tRNA(Gln) amidotransferase subunit B